MYPLAELIGVSSLLKDLHIRKCLSEHLDETGISPAQSISNGETTPTGGVYRHYDFIS